MNKPFTLLTGFLLLLIMHFLPGCSVVGGIFKAGVWVGVLAVLLVVGIIIYFVSKSSGNK